MKYIYRTSLFISIIAMAACSHMQHPMRGDADSSVELPQKPMGSRYELPYGMTGAQEIDMATIMSNDNVIVYPVDGQSTQFKRQFPKYRGTMENTTASGYTVFDPSVTVYAVEQGDVARPSYLPEYSVPRYTQPQGNINGNGQLMPVPLNNNYGDDIIAEPLMGQGIPRSPRPNRAGEVSQPVDRSSMQIQQPQAGAGRRSSPMLTGY